MGAVWFAVFSVPFCTVRVPLKVCVSWIFLLLDALLSLNLSPSPSLPLFLFLSPSPHSPAPSGTEWHQLHTLSSPSAPVDLIISLLKYSVLCSHLWQILTFLLETKVIHLLCEFSSAVNDRRDPLAKCSHFRGFITFKKKRVQVKMKLTDLLKGMILYTRKSFPC